MVLGCFQSREKLVCHCGLVLGIDGVSTSHHEDKVKVKAEVLEAVANLIEVFWLGAGNDWNLHSIKFYSAELLELFHLRENNELALTGSWSVAIIVRNDSSYPSGVGSNDSNFNVGFVDDISHGVEAVSKVSGIGQESWCPYYLSTVGNQVLVTPILVEDRKKA